MGGQKKNVGKNVYLFIWVWTRTEIWVQVLSFPGLTAHKWILMLSQCIYRLFATFYAPTFGMISVSSAKRVLVTQNDLLHGVPMPKVQQFEHHHFDINKIRSLNLFKCKLLQKIKTFMSYPFKYKTYFSPHISYNRRSVNIYGIK